MKALVLGGGLWQVPIIRHLQLHGHEVTVVDPNTACAARSIAKAHIKIDIRDHAAILKELKRGDFEIVTSDQTDAAVESVAHICKEWGLCCNTPEAVARFLDKTECRRLAKKLNLSQPEFTEARSLDTVVEFMKANKGPYIIKPADSQSSRGVTKIEHANDPKLAEAVGFAITNSVQKKLIVEQFIKGREITVEGLCSAGKHRALTVSIKEHFRTAIASKLHYPAGLARELEDAIFADMDKFVENSGLQFGITHAEFMVDIEAGKHWLVEIACRGGGTRISSDIAPWVSGVDFYDVFYSELRGQSTDVKSLVRKQRGAILGFFEFPAGTVREIRGVDEAKKMQGVCEVCLEFKVGDQLKAASDDRGRQGFAIVFGKDAADAEKLWQRVRETVRVKVG